MGTQALGARLLVVIGLLVAVVYLLIVELGISAGRVHHGITVHGIELGGLTRSEAAARLRARARVLKEAPVVLTGHGLDRSLLPTDVDWRPRPERTAARAMRVGRKNAPFGALVDRMRAWVRGVELEWAGRPDPDAMVAYVNAVRRDAAASGLDVDRAALRRRIKAAFSTWPRRPVQIPLKA